MLKTCGLRFKAQEERRLDEKDPGKQIQKVQAQTKEERFESSKTQEI